ncbi:MAG: hypothetical protein ACJ0QL_05665 [Parvicellaceae bacterium]
MGLDDMNEGFLQVTNHKEHPTNKAYKVFFFYTKQESLYFKSLLEESQIFFEQGSDQTKKGDIFLFGIRKTDLNKVSKINYETLGKFRKPIFANKKLQFFILGLGLFILLITLISYIVSQ